MKRTFFISLLAAMFMLISWGYYTSTPQYAIAQFYGGAISHYGETLPSTCADVGTFFWDSDDNLLYICDPANTWTAVGGGSGSTSDTEWGASWNGVTTVSPSKNVIHDIISLWDTNYNKSLEDDTITHFMSALKLNALSNEPSSPVQGRIYLADETNWDPAGLGIGVAYYVICTNDTPGSEVYTVLWDINGVLYSSSIATPTLEEDELDDTGDPGADGYDLTVGELKNKILSNAGMTAAMVYNCPARTEGWNFIVMIEAAYSVDICPNTGETWYLNGTAMTASECIVNDGATAGESMACFSTETAVYCESKYSNFEEETPP